MTDVWPAIIATLGTLGGTLMGAFASGWVTRRREDFALRRDLYIALLRALNNHRVTQIRYQFFWESRLPTNDAAALQHEAHQRFGAEFRESRARLDDAIAAALIVLDDRTRDALYDLEHEDAEAIGREDFFESLRARRDAISKTAAAVLSAARADLGVKTTTTISTSRGPKEKLS